MQRTAKDAGKSDFSVRDTIEATQQKTRYKFDIKKELEGYFTHQKNGTTEQVMPKHVHAGRSGIYCYFFMRGQKAISLKLHIEYPDYDADFYELEVGGETVSYEANKAFTAAATAQIVEGATFRWYDNAVNLSDEELLDKIKTAGEATLNLKVKETNTLLASIKLTKEECESMARTIEYYKALDGSKIPKRGMVNIRS